MNKTLSAITLICALSACKKSNEHLQTIEEVPNVEIALSALGTPAYSSAVQGDAAYNFLGYGYDITSKHASADAVRAQIVDIPTYVAKLPIGANPISNGTSSSFNTFFARDAAELSGQLSSEYEETDGLKLFKPTITTAFPESDALTNKFGYGYYTNVFVRRSIRIWAPEALSSLSGSFVQDVNNMNPEQLVKKYGTHILQRIHVGTRINIIYQSEVPDDVERKQVVTQGINYAIENTFGLLTLNFDELNVKALNANSAIKLRYEVIGGDPTQLKVLDFNGKKKVDLNDWNKSITESNYKFIGFSERKGIVPLYEMIENASKKTVVKEYIEKYILDSQGVSK